MSQLSMGEYSESSCDRSELNRAEHQRELFLLCILRGRFWSIAGCRVSSKEPGFPIDVPDQTKFRWNIQRLIYSESRRFFTVVYVHPSTILIQSEACICGYDEPDWSVVRAWDINFTNSLLSAKFMFRWMAELRAASGDLVQTQRNLERDQETLWEMRWEERRWEAGDRGGDTIGWRGSLEDDWSDESRNQPLTEELLRRHDKFFGVPNRSGQTDANSVGASSAFTDRYEHFKEQANQALVQYHGAHDGSSHALHLDGRRLRTTNTLVEAGWPPSHLHIPNNCPRDFACIQTLLRDSDAKQDVNVYELSSSQFLGHLCIQIWAGQWNPDKHPELPRASSPFSLVYLDYTTNKHRHNDLEILLKRKLFTCGVLAVTCPESTHGISVDDDRHRMEERKQRIRIPSGLAGMDWHVGFAADFPCAGLFKMFFFWTTCDAACCSAFTYTGRGRRTRMWFALFKVQLSGGIQAEPWFALPTKLLKRELCLFLFLRASKRSPAEKFMKEVEELSWKELQNLSRADFPTLWALVDFVRRVDK